MDFLISNSILMSLSILFGTARIIFLILFLCDFIDIFRFEYKHQLRLKLLQNVSIYIEPFDDIWKNQKLKNKNISVELKSFIIYIKNNSKIFKIKGKLRAIEDMYNLILQNFSFNTTYDNLIRVIELSIATSKHKYDVSEKENKENCNNFKIDINNCSIQELTKLPGVNIVLAKRIAKQREIIHGFKTKETFFKFIKLKSHHITQISKIIRINKIKIVKQIDLQKERTVDL